MGHDDGSNDTHSLQKFLMPTALAIGEEYALQHLLLIGFHYHILQKKQQQVSLLPGQPPEQKMVRQPCDSTCKGIGCPPMFSSCDFPRGGAIAMWGGGQGLGKYRTEEGDSGKPANSQEMQKK